MFKLVYYNKEEIGIVLDGKICCSILYLVFSSLFEIDYFSSFKTKPSYVTKNKMNWCNLCVVTVPVAQCTLGGWGCRE